MPSQLISNPKWKLQKNLRDTSNSHVEIFEFHNTKTYTLGQGSRLAWIFNPHLSAQICQFDLTRSNFRMQEV
jgi:hypothetical protein